MIETHIKVGIIGGDSYLSEIFGDCGKYMCSRGKREGRINHRFQLEGWPQQFLLQLSSNLTSILTILFLLFLNYSNTTVKPDNFCYVLKNPFPPCVPMFTSWLSSLAFSFLKESLLHVLVWPAAIYDYLTQ